MLSSLETSGYRQFVSQGSNNGSKLARRMRDIYENAVAYPK